MHLSQDAGLYTQEKRYELLSLKKQYGTPLPNDIFESFITNVDNKKMNAVDKEYMDNILKFIDTSMH